MISSARWGSRSHTAEPSRPALSIEDLYRLEAHLTPRLSPDARQVAYIRQWVDPETRRERSSLWLAPGGSGKPRPLEPDQADARSPVFSPDGRRIAFLSTRPRPPGWIPTPPAPPELTILHVVHIFKCKGLF